MPRYIFEINGKRHVFEGPDPQTTQRFAEQWAQHPTPAAQSSPTLGSVAGQFGRGVVQGGAQLLDQLGDAFNPTGAIDRGVTAMRNMPRGTNPLAASFNALTAPGPAQRLASPVTNKQPTNGAERFARTAGNFVPNALVPGGEVGLGAKALGAGVRVLAPAVGATVAPAIVKAAGGNATAQGVAGVVGGAIGGGLPDALPSVGNAFKSAVLGTSRRASPEVAALAKVAMEKHGIPLRTGQIEAAGASGNRAAGITDSNLIASNPAYRASQLAQKQAFTNAVGKTFGASGPLTTDTMASARSRLSAGFEAHAAQNGAAADPQLAADLAKVSSQAGELGLSDNEVAALNKQIAKIGEVADSANGRPIATANDPNPLSRADQLSPNRHVVFDTTKPTGIEGIFPTEDAAKTFVEQSGNPHLDYASQRDAERWNPTGPESPEYEDWAIQQRIKDALGQSPAATASGIIPGPAYQAMTQSGSTLSNIIGSGHGAFANLGKSIRTALADASARAGGPDAAAQLADLRSQWANMKTVEPLAEKAGPEGLISPALLQGRVNATFDNAAYGSGGDLKELGDIGQTFLKEPANSQTAPRLLDKLSALKGPAATAGAVGDVLLGAHDLPAAIGAAGTAAAGYAAAKGAQAFKALKSNNPIATNALLGGPGGGPMPVRILNALQATDPNAVPAALMSGVLAQPSAAQADPSASQ